MEVMGEILTFLAFGFGFVMCLLLFVLLLVVFIGTKK